MTILSARDLKADVKATGGPRAARFRVELVRDWRQATSRWTVESAGTPFQDTRWISAWYDAFGERGTLEPLIALVLDAATSEPIALLPLVRRSQSGIRIVEFADLGLTDYNAPLLARGAPDDPAGMAALCRALISALRRLPGGADLLRLQKMPSELGGHPNPFASPGRAGSCSLNGNLIDLGDDIDSYRAAIKRMQLPRSWRVFSRYPGAAFRIVASPAEALALLATTDAQQEARMRSLGLEFNLDSGPRAKFYRELIGNGLGDGYVVVAALTCDEATVATALGIRRDNTFIFLRISNAGERWSHCSPSRLIIERSIDALSAQGITQFDLSIGNYAFKRRFGASPIPLTDVSLLLGWRGLPLLLRDCAAQWIRRYPALSERVGRLLGKRAAHEL
ncbi:GNAT family N-acetyltransferase [Bradyrhizobium sp.]|uniref:GNAT family N-acetyltransferase n=1 Tax=Bradyrhizobium sp. TaxID=376 RepID=UPI0025C0DEC0|nr:GNAT family N-acetyltransferase [Bradyrhizobium sp.]MBV8921204.1 GNAT family N-acetyltransferase [Bradyrhizobium sp.]